MEYIAKQNPHGVGRSGNALYKSLFENVCSLIISCGLKGQMYLLPQERKWKWAKRHTWQSWRDRYYKNKEEFDRKIRKYQKKHGINPIQPPKAFSSARRKRARDEHSDSNSEEEGESEGGKNDTKRKRQKVEEVQKRAKVKREQRESMKEEEEEDKGGGTSRGALSGKIMRHRLPTDRRRVSIAIRTRSKHAKPKPKSRATEDQNAADGSSDDGDAEDEEEEKEDRGPVGSDDYEGDIFGTSEEDELEEGEVIELTDAHTDNETEEGEVIELTDAHTDSETEVTEYADVHTNEAMDIQEVDQQLIVVPKSESTSSLSRAR